MIRLFFSALIGLPLIGGQLLTTDYTRDQALRIEVESSFSMETVDFSMEVDGEPQESRWGGGMNSTESRRIVMIDTVLEHDDGTPTRIRREFEELSADSIRQMGDREFESERECPLNEVVLELSLDGGDVTAEVIEGSEPDNEAVLEGHQLTLALDALLPEEEVEAGDSWKMEGDAMLRAVGFDVEAALFPPPTRDAEGGDGEGGRGGRGRGMRGGGADAARFFQNGDWTVEATLEADTEDWQGVTCHVIKLEVEGEGELPERERGDRGGRGGGGGGGGAAMLASAPIAPENSYEVELEGVLYFSVEGGCPVHFEVEGSVATESVTERSRGESSMVMTSSKEGQFKYSVDVTRVASEDEN